MVEGGTQPREGIDTSIFRGKKGPLLRAVYHKPRRTYSPVGFLQLMNAPIGP